MIGDIIKQRREELNISQSELGRRLGKSRAAICKIEKGERDINTKNLAEMAKALECSIADLVKTI